ncbi:FMN-dependent NADH-azoreductase [Bordetella sp. BOR01]|uniref:FMN-dependent NADH-azoreductase n=1 Tax=Bordetella sp. BOR01 TaxID=2854779 RepID=UPI001C45F3B7|nr:NAD(P)H-dependent oxidoreductase [Bordetella sp. BOR01]MBV7483436.1 NAD(P)H-dependent oxidoreductase [Bordetella sp. BOR01]
MKKILRLICSPRAQASESYRLSEMIASHLMQRYPEADLLDRQLSAGTIAHVDTDYAAVLGGMKPPTGIDHLGSLAESEMLIRELEQTDGLIIGTPMHNYTVPSALKAWVDHIVRVHRTFQPTRQGKIGTLRDRPTFIAISSGGTYAGEPPRQPDFLTPYLTAILNTVGIRDITFFSMQGSAYGADAAQQARTAAYASVQEHFAAVST